MTVADWIRRREAGAPAELVAGMVDALGDDKDADESKVASACLAAAVRELRTIVDERRFGRDAAAELLVVDALTTCALEHASETAADVASLHRFAVEAAATLGATAPREST